MDSGVGGLDALVVGSETTTGLASDSETKQRWYGSGFLKQERSVTSEDDLRSCLKVAKTDDFSVSKAMLLHQQRSSPSSSSSSLRSEQQQMLSFSSPKSETFLLRTDTGSTYPYFPSAYNRNTGYNSGSLNAANMHGLLTGIRGPFTPSQWIELEHQALIYQYITANVPIPSNLLVPIRKALDFAGFSSFSGTPLRPSTLGWGTFHLGFANSTDPEPGRCRRTDGKKWRCSRDAVADQKYCERHMNRGRHRSRKPVEGQTGHSVAATTTTTTAKSMPIASSSLASVAVGSGSSSGSTSNSLTMMHNHQVNRLQLGASNASAAAQMERIFMNKENLGERMLDTPVLSMLSPTTTNLNSKDGISKQQMPYEESTQTQFGLVSSDSLLNPSNKPPTFMNCRNYGGSSSSHDEPESEPPQQRHPLRRFMDDWPKNQLSDRTQLSISIPSDFMSSTSSPTSEKPALSPLRLSMELDSTQMGLGVGSFTSEQQQNQRQANWIPISWETSMGGPLGEVLHNSTNSNKMDCRNTSPLNLMTEGWDHSPRLGSSPTGVLQKSTAFGSLSNSSAGSSPRAEYNKTHEGSSFCNDLLGSSLANSSSLPSL